MEYQVRWNAMPHLTFIPTSYSIVVRGGGLPSLGTRVLVPVGTAKVSDSSSGLESALPGMADTHCRL